MSDEFNNNGVVGEVVTQSTLSEKSKVAAALLSFFLGIFGIHRLYLGHTTTGLVMLIGGIIGVFLSLFWIGLIISVPIGIWNIVDFVCILTNKLVDAQGRKLR